MDQSSGPFLFGLTEQKVAVDKWGHLVVYRTTDPPSGDLEGVRLGTEEVIHLLVPPDKCEGIEKFVRVAKDLLSSAHRAQEPF